MGASAVPADPAFTARLDADADKGIEVGYGKASRRRLNKHHGVMRDDGATKAPKPSQQGAVAHEHTKQLGAFFGRMARSLSQTPPLLDPTQPLIPAKPHKKPWGIERASSEPVREPKQGREAQRKEEQQQARHHHPD